jgi:hypothetical protein
MFPNLSVFCLRSRQRTSLIRTCEQRGYLLDLPGCLGDRRATGYFCRDEEFDARIRGPDVGFGCIG